MDKSRSALNKERRQYCLLSLFKADLLLSIYALLRNIGKYILYCLQENKRLLIIFVKYRIRSCNSQI